jgi:nitric oxide dioxygenase
MITARQIALVQNSFALALPLTDTIAHDFYARLFEAVPETRVMFRSDMGEQGRKLFLTLATVVDALDSLGTVLPVAEALAVRHVGYGAQDWHYAAVGEALIAALAATLDDRFDLATRDAWRCAYTLLSDHMRAAAARAAPDRAAAA